MPKTGLSLWSDLKPQFQHCLLLGNGASIAIHRNFDYRNLVTKARVNSLITRQVKTVFDHFGTADFEYVLNMVWHAHHLNEALGIRERKTTRAYRKVREPS